MTELVDRYVHRVGRYLPPKERAEIEAELRSQIQDQLDDRFAGAPTAEEVASVLAEFGHPYQMAASYNREQYLVGPDLYPYMMMILRYLWVLAPIIVIFLNVFGALAAARQGMWLEFIFETLFAVVQATLVLSAVVILIFAIIQRASSEIDEMKEPFDPLSLPKVDDPRSVDRFEEAIGMVISICITLVLAYFLRVGGLTLRFNLSDPGPVIPVPTAWLVLLFAAIFAQAITHLLALRRNRWNAVLWLVMTVAEVFGVICLYFAVLLPVFERIAADNPAQAHLLSSAPAIIAAGLALLTLVDKGIKLVRLWSYRNNSAASVAVKRNA